MHNVEAVESMSAEFNKAEFNQAIRDALRPFGVTHCDVETSEGVKYRLHIQPECQMLNLFPSAPILVTTGIKVSSPNDK